MWMWHVLNVRLICPPPWPQNVSVQRLDAPLPILEADDTVPKI